MKLTPKKVQYSSKHGVSIEWQRPDEIVIGSSDLLVLLLCLKGNLTQEEMDQHFTPEEQEVILKYYLQIEQKHADMMASYFQKVSFKRLRAEFQHCLDWWKCCYEDGIKTVMTKVWGWRLSTEETLPLVDKLILGALKTDSHNDLYRIKFLVSSYLGDPKMSEPLPDTKEKVEAKFGPLDWAELKAEGILYYQKFHPPKGD